MLPITIIGEASIRPLSIRSLNVLVMNHDQLPNGSYELIVYDDHAKHDCALAKASVLHSYDHSTTHQLFHLVNPKDLPV